MSPTLRKRRRRTDRWRRVRRVDDPLESAERRDAEGGKGTDNALSRDLHGNVLIARDARRVASVLASTERRGEPVSSAAASASGRVTARASRSLVAAKLRRAMHRTRPRRRLNRAKTGKD